MAIRRLGAFLVSTRFYQLDKSDFQEKRTLTAQIRSADFDT